MNIFRWNSGSVQSKAISLLTLASIILPLLAPAYTYAADLPPSVPNSNVFTMQTEAPKVDGPTGAFTQRVPLDIPPGRNGLQPDVSLQYNSQNTDDGIVGYGWSLPIPFIQRLNKTGSQDLYDNSPYFTSSLEGEIVASTTITAAAYSAVPSVESNTNGPTSAVICSVTSVTFAKSVSATSTLLIVDVEDPLATGVTYAGVAMTLATTSPGTNTTWYLVNPTLGSNNVVVTLSASSGGNASAVSFTGTDTTNPLGAMAFQHAGTGNPSVSISTNYDNSLIADNIYYGLADTMTPNSPQVKQLTLARTSSENVSFNFFQRP